jgi:hypothetical protein
MIISHDRNTLFIGVPKNGSQTARAVLGQLGTDLVGEMGRHPTVPEAIRLAEVRFPGEVIAPTAIYAFWRDPVERFCSAVEFHKRCLPNSFIQLFPERFAGIKAHSRWFETDPDSVSLELRLAISQTSPLDVIGILTPLTSRNDRAVTRGGKLSFYRPQVDWLREPSIIRLSFAHYETQLRELIHRFGGAWDVPELPRLNCDLAPSPLLSEIEIAAIKSLYEMDQA